MTRQSKKTLDPMRANQTRQEQWLLAVVLWGDLFILGAIAITLAVRYG